MGFWPHLQVVPTTQQPPPVEHEVSGPWVNVAHSQPAPPLSVTHETLVQLQSVPGSGQSRPAQQTAFGTAAGAHAVALAGALSVGISHEQPLPLGSCLHVVLVAVFATGAVGVPGVPGFTGGGQGRDVPAVLVALLEQAVGERAAGGRSDQREGDGTAGGAAGGGARIDVADLVPAAAVTAALIDEPLARSHEQLPQVAGLPAEVTGAAEVGRGIDEEHARGAQRADQHHERPDNAVLPGRSHEPRSLSL